MEKLLNSMKRFCKTLFWFLTACSLVPVLICSFIGVYYIDRLNRYVLSLWYPKYTISHSKKIRTLIDTPRNAGIFHFLLQVKGKCNFELIKEQYRDNLTEARFKNGELKFPKLKQQLVARWGHYAWVKDSSSFNINNHVVLSPRNYRGRPVNDTNIEGFISELVTKYIPSEIPQWQVIVIPTATAENEDDQEEHFYILVKLHHLLIAEETELHISDMLMLKEKDNPNSKHQLSCFVEKPKHITKLSQVLWLAIVKLWNKFIYEFESLETPDGSPRLPITNITQLISLLIIIPVNTTIKYWNILKLRKKYAKHRLPPKNPKSMRAEFTILLKEEILNRQLTFEMAKVAIYSSLLPSNIIKTYVKLFWDAVLIPFHCFLELLALRDIIFNKGQTTATKTYCKTLADYLPLVINALQEFLNICYEIFKAPVNIYEELFQHRSREPNYLHIKTYSGRKIVSFSKSIKIETNSENSNPNAGMQDSDFRLACLAGSIFDYFESLSSEASVPRLLNTTYRTFVKNYFTDHESDKTEYIGGVVFLKLPLKKPERDQVEQIHSIVDHIKAKQLIIYLCSIGQTKFDLVSSILPRVVTKVFINYFSSNFPVTITEISGPNDDFELLWGQQVEDVLLFRPPQSKTCLSLNLHTFGNRCRLAIMADTQLGPSHTIITRSFENYMENYKSLKDHTRHLYDDNS